jgi:hypothetical protein
MLQSNTSKKSKKAEIVEHPNTLNSNLLATQYKAYAQNRLLWSREVS